MLRVHDVAETVQAVRVWQALGGGEGGMNRKLFGTDGVRGRANTHPMTAEVAMRLGHGGRRGISRMASTGTAS